MTQLGAALRKDLLLQWRTRAQAGAVFAFGATALLLFSFAVGPDSRALRQDAAGFLWVGLLFASVLALSASFAAEREESAFEGLLLLPARPFALYLGKALANALQLFLLGAALLPVMAVFYDASLARLPHLLAVLFLGAAGISAPGTFYAAMTSQLRAQSLLLPLLLLPLAVPVLLAAIKATSLLLLGDPMGQLGSWTLLLFCFDAVFWPLCGLLFAAVVED